MNFGFNLVISGNFFYRKFEEAMDITSLHGGNVLAVAR